MLNSPERQQESLRPILAKIIKATGLVVAALLFQGCDGKNPNEAIIQSLQSGYLEPVRQDCKERAMEAVNNVGDISDSSTPAMLDEEILEKRCLEDRGVIVSGD